MPVDDFLISVHRVWSEANRPSPTVSDATEKPPPSQAPWSSASIPTCRDSNNATSRSGPDTVGAATAGLLLPPHVLQHPGSRRCPRNARPAVSADTGKPSLTLRGRCRYNPRIDLSPPLSRHHGRTGPPCGRSCT